MLAQWYFEMGNEPNVDFWGGIPRDESYYSLYTSTARSLKSVSPRLRVGGPATAAAARVPEFLAYCKQKNVPVDFVSTHGYANEPVKRLMGMGEVSAPEDRIGATIAHVRRQIDASAFSHLPLLWTEWNVNPAHNARETPYVGSAVANTVRESDGMVDHLSFWTFSEVFEEGGPPSSPFHYFGIRAIGGINKPAFYDFALLHQLGSQRIANESHDAIVTRSADGSLAIAVVWNLVPLDQKPHDRTITLDIDNVAADASVSVARVDDTHGNVMPFFKKIGSPNSPTQKQPAELNKRSDPGPPEMRRPDHGHITLTLGSNALYLLKVSQGSRK
jgi:xylan 1,4-beta-xylosidase